MMKCYLCNIELNENNKSIEHIIPQSIGGKLKSKDILCKDCNSKFGSNIDKKFVDNFEFISVIVNPKTDRHTKGLGLKAQIENSEVLLYRDIVISSQFKPKITKDNNKKYFEFGGIFSKINLEDKNKFEKNVEEILKNNGVNDCKDWIKNNIQVTDNEKPLIMLQPKIDIKEIVFGYLKVAIGYCFLKKFNCYIDKNILQEFQNFNFDFIEKNTALLSQDIFKDGRICHRIFLVGDEKLKKLFCIVGIYDFLHFAFVLNSDYSGENFIEKYCYDLLNQKEINSDISVSFNDININFSQDIMQEFISIFGNNISYIMQYFVGSEDGIKILHKLFFDLIDYIYCFENEILDKNQIEQIFKNSFYFARSKINDLKILRDKAFENMSNLFYDEYIKNVSNRNKYLNENIINFLKINNIDENLFMMYCKIYHFLQENKWFYFKGYNNFYINMKQNF